MPVSDLVLLKSEDTLMIFTRSTEVLNFVVFGITIRIIYVMLWKHSPPSLGAYKYCLYQIVTWPLIAQQCLVLGPVFTMPIIGAYHYEDFTDNPLCVWILISAFDIEAILDGFNFRLRILLITFQPKLANKTFWILATLNAKVLACLLVGLWIAPVGQHLNRADMRVYLLSHYPNVVDTFDEYKSFVVYDVKQVTGFREGIIGLTAGTVTLFVYGIMVLLAIFK